MSKLEEKDSLDKILENSDSTDSSPQNINEMSHAQLGKQSRSSSITNDNNEKNDAKLSKELESQMPPLQMTKTDKEYMNFPDGGLAAWLVVGAASTIMAMSFGMVNSFGVYQTYYEQEFSSVSSNKISLIGSVQACFTMLLGIPSTVVMYYIGPQMVVLIGSIFCIASFMILSVVKRYWQAFLVQGILFGIGSGLIYIHSTGVLFQYFNKKKALVQGIITGGASIAGVYWPIGIRKLIAKVGFPWANRIIGFIYIPMGIFSVIFLRPRIPPPARKPGENFLRLDFSVLKDWKLWILCMAIFTFMLSLFPGFFYVDLFCERLEVAEYLQEYNVPIVNAIACFARIIPGFIGDYVGRMNINILFLAATGILPLAIWMNARSTGSTLAFCITWAIASGGPVCLTPAIVGQLFPGKELPSCLSLFFAWGGLGGLLGPTIGGSFIPRGHVKGVQGFNHLAIFVGIMAFVSMSCVILVRTWYTRKILYKI